MWRFEPYSRTTELYCLRNEAHCTIYQHASMCFLLLSGGNQMAGFTIEVSVALVAAVFIAEVISAVWYSGPWGRYGTRYFLSGIICDVGLVVLLQIIIL